MIKRLIFSFFITYYLMGCSSTVTTIPRSEFNSKEAEKTIVKVISDSENQYHGTGFIIGVLSNATYILTANHVVEKGNVKVKFRNDVILYDTEKLNFDNKIDLALLKVQAVPNDVKCYFLDESELEKDNEYAAIGFPRLGEWFLYPLTFSGRQKSSLIFSSGGIVEIGSSGGSIIRKTTNKVVGMITGIEGNVVAVGVSTLMNFLKGITPEGEKLLKNKCEIKGINGLNNTRGELKSDDGIGDLPINNSLSQGTGEKKLNTTPTVESTSFSMPSSMIKNGAMVGQIKVIDKENNVDHYEFIDGNKKEIFNINNNGKITIQDSTFLHPDERYNLAIKVTDTDGAIGKGEVSIFFEKSKICTETEMKTLSAGAMNIIDSNLHQQQKCDQLLDNEIKFRKFFKENKYKIGDIMKDVRDVLNFINKNCHY